MYKYQDLGLAVILVFIIFFFSFTVQSTINPSNLCSDSLGCHLKLNEEYNNPDSCNYYENASKCYEQSVYILEDISLCEYTQDPDNCYISSSIYFENFSVCDRVQDYDSCVFSYAVGIEDYSYCEKHTDKEICIYSYAVSKNDKNICELSGAYKNMCENEIEN